MEVIEEVDSESGIEGKHCFSVSCLRTGFIEAKNCAFWIGM
jgi:hypothetical protein